MTDLAPCRNYLLDALLAEFPKRDRLPHDEWVAGVHLAMAVTANQWAEAHGMARRVNVTDVERVEQMAVGHVDYASKFALYVAELLHPFDRGAA